MTLVGFADRDCNSTGKTSPMPKWPPHFGPPASARCSWLPPGGLIDGAQDAAGHSMAHLRPAANNGPQRRSRCARARALKEKV